METRFDREKKTRPATRARLATLGACRRELARVYDELKGQPPDALRTTHYRALAFIVSSIGEILRNEKLDEIVRRLDALERREKQP